jgi:hypothetical protein
MAGGSSFAKINSDGAVIWSRTMASGTDRTVFAVAEGTDGYYICGWIYRYPNRFYFQDNDV